MSQSQSGTAYFCKLSVSPPPPASHLCAIDEARNTMNELTLRTAGCGARTLSLFNMIAAIGTTSAIEVFQSNAKASLGVRPAGATARTVLLSLDLANGVERDDAFVFWLLHVVSNGIKRGLLQAKISLTSQLEDLSRLPLAELIQLSFVPPRSVISRLGRETGREPMNSFAEAYTRALDARRTHDVICYMDGDGMNAVGSGSAFRKTSLFAMHGEVVTACCADTSDPAQLLYSIYQTRKRTDGYFNDLVEQMLTYFRSTDVRAVYLGGDEIIAAGELQKIRRGVETCCAESALEIGFSAGFATLQRQEPLAQIASQLEKSLAATKAALRGKGYFNILAT